MNPLSRFIDWLVAASKCPKCGHRPLQFVLTSEITNMGYDFCSNCEWQGKEYLAL